MSLGLYGAGVALKYKDRTVSQGWTYSYNFRVTCNCHVNKFQLFPKAAYMLIG